MLLNLIRQAVKAALHRATEEWLLETGLSHDDVASLRAHRLAVAAQHEAQADAQAARALQVHEDEEADRPCLSALAMPSAARHTEFDACPPPDAGEEALLAWVHHQREQNHSWSEIARLANEQGHAVREDALRLRHKRWKERMSQQDAPNS